MIKKFRGATFRGTLPAVFAFSAIWIGVLVVTAPVLTITMMMSGIVPPEFHRDIWFFLFTRVPVIALAGALLAVFTTARLAGPLVRLRHTFERVKDGDMDQRISFRQRDSHLRELERAFNEMMEALNARTDTRGGAEADDQSYSTTSV